MTEPSARRRYSSLPSSAAGPSSSAVPPRSSGASIVHRSRGTGPPSALRCSRSCTSWPSTVPAGRPSRRSAHGLTYVMRPEPSVVRTPTPASRSTARGKSGSGTTRVVFMLPSPRRSRAVRCAGTAPTAPFRPCDRRVPTSDRTPPPGMGRSREPGPRPRGRPPGSAAQPGEGGHRQGGDPGVQRRPEDGGEGGAVIDGDVLRRRRQGQRPGARRRIGAAGRPGGAGRAEGRGVPAHVRAGRLQFHGAGVGAEVRGEGRRDPTGRLLVVDRGRKRGGPLDQGLLRAEGRPALRLDDAAYGVQATGAGRNVEGADVDFDDGTVEGGVRVAPI